MVNIRKGTVNILVAPSTEDKLILIDAIKMCLTKVYEDNKGIEKLIHDIVDIYNKSYLMYTNLDNINYYDIFVRVGIPLGLNNLSFLSEYSVATIIDKLRTKTKLTDIELIEFKIQMFIYASVWFDMDKYLKYLYYLYK